MDFKRIEWIFLVVFIGINIFLGIEIFQTPTLLSNSHTTTPTDLTSEMANDNISLPKLSDQQGDGYYLAAKVNNDWTNKANKQISVDADVSTSDGMLTVILDHPVTISHKADKMMKDIEKFKDNPKNVYHGSDYSFVPELSSTGEYSFAQKNSYGEIFSTAARLHITVKDHQIVSYTQRYVGNATPVRERQTTISEKAAVGSLYTYSELPNDSKVVWVHFAYSKLIEVRGSRIFLPTWVVAIQNNNTKTVTIKRVNAFNGNILQNNTISEDKEDNKSND
ncbi:two-component system regulatory protein YycI [uncultured Lactobacillus sp.]|uniref:two-component system regulatory protein YycI n=1 Tax=uncultured Lactobacillus sp. TaxID=153152 RepID=UPI0026297D6C|nr:two-component system regulatory protein YycI [uncultured Lactobacillus sp.]